MMTTQERAHELALLFVAAVADDGEVELEDGRKLWAAPAPLPNGAHVIDAAGVAIAEFATIDNDGVQELFRVTVAPTSDPAEQVPAAPAHEYIDRWTRLNETTPSPQHHILIEAMVQADQSLTPESAEADEIWCRAAVGAFEHIAAAPRGERTESAEAGAK